MWQRRDAFVAVRGPQTKLDPALVALRNDPSCRDPPMLHYGVVFDRDVLKSYATREDIQISDVEATLDAKTQEMLLQRAVRDRLESKCKFALQFTIPFAQDDDRCLLALDDTRQLRHTKSKWWNQRAESVIQILKRELQLKSTVKAKWWWNFRYGVG